MSRSDFLTITHIKIGFEWSTYYVKNTRVLPEPSLSPTLEADCVDLVSPTIRDPTKPFMSITLQDI